MEHFTPWSSALGGGLIGLAAAVMWGTNGRIAGISGILGGLLSRPGPDHAWRLAFMMGLLGGPWLVIALMGRPQMVVTAGFGVLIAAGLLVGFGTRLGGGCTSGHGVCGLARLSRRSMVATALFMIAAVVTVFVTRHVMGG